MPDEQQSASAAAASPALIERSDELMGRALGGDLQRATVRGALYLLAACAIFATLAALVG